MTDTDSDAHDGYTTPVKPSPNDRDKKKTRTEEETPEETDPMNLDTSVRRLYDPDASSELASTNSNATKNDNAIDDSDDDKPFNTTEDNPEDNTVKPVINIDEDDESNNDYGDAVAESPFLNNIDLADTMIWSSTIKDSNALWASNPAWDNEEPFVTDGIHGTGEFEFENSLTAQLELGSDYLTSEASGSGRTTVAEWMQIFEYAFESAADDLEDCHTLRRMGIRLAKSDPVLLFPTSSWENGRLLMNYEGHVAWVAAYHIFGAPWKDRRHWFMTTPTAPAKTTDKPSSLKRTASGKQKPASKSTKNSTNKPTASTPKSNSKSVGFAAKALSTTTSDKTTEKPEEIITKKLKSKNPLYLNKPLIVNPYKQKKLKKLKDHGRKHRTYIKVKFAKITTDSIAEQQEELSNCFSNILTKIWGIDPTMLVLVWKDELGTEKPLKQNSEFPKTKDQMLRYADRLCIEKSKSAYCRMILNHDRPPTSLFDDDTLQLWLEEQELSVSIERIQAVKTGCAGHLLGYHALACNVTNLADAIEQHPAMKRINVEVRSEFVSLGDHKNRTSKNKDRTKTKILKLYVAWTRTSDARHALIQIYSSKANGLYPLGTMARIIPDISDTRFVRTSANVLAYKNSLRKHIKFMDGSKVHPSYNIIELDHYLPKLRMTLRQAIMHIFSSSKPDCNLFLAVDTSFYGDCVIFAFRDELQEEAINMISALPLFLEASTGRQLVHS